MTSELLGFHAYWVSDEKTLVVLDEDLLELSLGSLVVELLVVSNQALGDGLTDSHELGGGSTSADANANVQVLEFLSTEEQDGLPDFQAEGSGLEKLEWFSVDFDESSAGCGVGHGGGVLLSAEALYLFCFFINHLFFLRYRLFLLRPS